MSSSTNTDMRFTGVTTSWALPKRQLPRRRVLSSGGLTGRSTAPCCTAAGVGEGLVRASDVFRCGVAAARVAAVAARGS